VLPQAGQEAGVLAYAAPIWLKVSYEFSTVRPVASATFTPSR
jgi:hypothetical protein